MFTYIHIIYQAWWANSINVGRIDSVGGVAGSVREAYQTVSALSDVL